MTDYTDLARRLRQLQLAVCERAADLLDAMGRQKPAAWLITCRRIGGGQIATYASLVEDGDEYLEWEGKWECVERRKLFLQPAQPQEQREPTFDNADDLIAYLHSQREPTRSEKMREAGFTRRPSWRSLPTDSMDDEPTEAQIADACLSYRHDFWLLPRSEQAVIVREAQQWARAFGLRAALAAKEAGDVD